MDSNILLIIIFGIIFVTIIIFGLRSHKKTDFTDPIKLKENVEKEIKKKDEKFFKELIYYQNYDIYNAMFNGEKETTYKFYRHFQNINPDEYRDWFTERAKEYYKKYKIDGDKISWE